MEALVSSFCAPAAVQALPWPSPTLSQQTSSIPRRIALPIDQSSLASSAEQTLTSRTDILDRESISLLLQKNVPPLEGKFIHVCVVRSGLDSDTFVANLLISMYGRYGLVEEACYVFDHMPHRTMVSWSAMISVCSKHSQSHTALSLYKEMIQWGFQPNNVVFVSVLTACGNLASLDDARLLHSDLVEYGIYVEEVLGTSLLNMYGKCGDLEAARRMFNSMPVHDTISWNALISAYDTEECSREAGELFEIMQERNIMLDKSTFINCLTAYANVCQIIRGRHVHRLIVEHGLDFDTEVMNALIHLYAMCGALHDAQSVFDTMEMLRDVVSWNSIISAYAQQGKFVEVFAIFQEMQDANVKPTRMTFLNLLSACISSEALSVGKNIHKCIYMSEGRYGNDMLVATALINMYGNCGSPEDAREIFNQIASPDVVCWNAMIACYVRQHQGERALDMFDKMQNECLHPDEATFTSILSACADMEVLPKGMLIHRYAVNYGFDSNIGILHALIHMYGNYGKLDEAQTLFDCIKAKEFLSWNVMITVYAQQGHGKKAIGLYEKMLQDNVKPNEVTFVSLFSACSHAGLINEGYYYFVSMSEVHNLTPLLEHYVCLIDLLGRAGRLDEAEDLICDMPYKATPAVWCAMLGACKLHGDINRAKCVAHMLSKLNQQDEPSYVVL